MSHAVRVMAWIVIASIAVMTAASADADETAHDHIARLQAMIMHSTTSFSASRTLAELDAMSVAPGSADAGRIAQLRSNVELKIARGDDAIRHGDEALHIDAAQPFLTPDERLHLVYDLARYQELHGDCAGAIPRYRQVIAMMEAAKGDPDKLLGTKERLGYCLHEARQFEAARRVNLEVLAGGERIEGPESPRLTTVLTNLAQNAYELGDHASARASLERSLAIATKADKQSVVDSMLFQLGVLAFEDGHPDEASRLMDRRLSLAKASGDAARIKAATDDLDALHDKLGR